MGAKFLLELLENRSVPNAVVEIDLLKVAREFVINNSSKPSQQPQQKKIDDVSSKFCLVVDGECCLNRLYGGFLSDWICGGQWNRMAEFLDKLVSLTEAANIEMTVFFNGAIESQRMNEWIVQQKREYEKVNRVLAHVAKFGYPPGNRLWIAPVGLRTALRMMLRHKNVNVVSTIDDYRQEVIAYCRENHFHGIITDDAEYIAFDPPRLFSASKLKLKFKGTLESREFIISELMRELQLTNEKLCLLVALLGNYLLADQDLRDVYRKANIDLSNENTAECVVRKMAKYLDDIDMSNDLDEIVIHIFGTDNDARAPALKQSIQYYMDGTKDGFLKYRSVSSGKRSNGGGSGDDCSKNLTDKVVINVENSSEDISQEPNLDTSKLASENICGEKNLLNAYKEAQSCLNANAGPGDAASTTTTSEDYFNISGNSLNVSVAGNYDTIQSSEAAVISFSNSSENTAVTMTTTSTLTTNSAKATSATTTTSKIIKQEKPTSVVLPPVPHEVMRTVSERHSKGLMSPYIYQILSQGEIKLPVVLEDGKQIPNVYLFYKPIRQMVYAIVFNLHHHMYMASKNNTAVQVDIRIKEWIFDTTAQSHKVEYVKAEPVGWRVPTIQRLWFGTTQDDKRRRLRAFLTCMRSDVQLLLNPEFVPQQLLVAAVVLRYIMSFPDEQVLRKPELDAFIVAALSPEFSHSNFIQDLKIAQLSSRGVQLAALFMKGVEMAMLVNDACGAPIPWLMCCPWLFFDGRLFQYMLIKATNVKNLHELSDNRVGLVMRAERMRQAILEGLNVQFARPPLPSTLISPEEFKSTPFSHQHLHQHQHQHQHQHHHQHRNSHPHIRPSYANQQHRMRITPAVAAAAVSSSCSLSSTPSIAGGGGVPPGRARRSLGGRLEIAGVVVGSWGANYNMSQPLYEPVSATAAYFLPTAGAAQQAPPPPPPLHHQHRYHHPHRVAAVGNYNHFGSSYKPRGFVDGGGGSGGFNSRQKNKNFNSSLIKKKSVKKERKMAGKGRGLGKVSGVTTGAGVSCMSSGYSNSSSASSTSGSAGNANVTVDVVIDSNLPNGRIGCDVNQADDQGARVDCGVSNDDRFQDAIFNGGDGDAKMLKTIQDTSSSAKSLVEPISK